MQIKNIFLFIVIALFCSSFTKAEATEKRHGFKAMPDSNDWIKTALAQKMMLDFRFYCEQKKKHCTEPLVVLNPEIKRFIRESGIGGVILFSENIQNTQQVTQLNQEFQLAASQSKSSLPLFIGIDQEGGRVARLPRVEYAAFSGNMAIGATYHSHKADYANEVGQAIGQQLHQLGFNLNFAPNVDVNNNPNNPVINVRSFGDNPKVVGVLGQAMSEGMRHANILTTAKHFPGHGNTSIDSHSGLSAVISPRQELEKVELPPFRYLSETNAVDFIMSAHIQFPALDNSQITSKAGLQITRPATLSRKIITGLLKKEYGFRGLVISDALDMGAIAKHFTAEQAVTETFNAGIDVALMPMVIDSPSQINAFTHLITKLKDKVLKGDINKQELWYSYQSILVTKLKLKTKAQEPQDQQLHNKEKGQQLQNKGLHQQLSDKSLTVLKGNGHLAIYRQETKQNRDNAIYRLLSVMPDSGKCEAFSNAINEAQAAKNTKNPKVKRVELTCLSEAALIHSQSKNTGSLSHGAKFDGLLIGSISPKQSPYEMVGVDQAERRQLRSISTNQKNARYMALFKKAKSLGLQTVFVSLRAPYEVEYFKAQVDSVMSTYSYNVYFESGTRSGSHEDSMENRVIKGEAYESIAKQLFGLIKGAGKSPVKTAKGT
ncbi:beta-N-acetylhexosaminidase [Psychrosphaera haliotis]|uniref:glycoside hydrolase family 3 N-terminal domain-containing protein n=1 Tax=Psychrosphaera haliotis TaxID=555083 RepID=UPI0031E20C7E